MKMYDNKICESLIKFQGQMKEKKIMDGMTDIWTDRLRQTAWSLYTSCFSSGQYKNIEKHLFSKFI